MGCSFLFLLALVRVQHGCAKRTRAYTSWCLGAVSSNMEFLLLVLYIKATTTAHKTFLLNRDWWNGADLLLCREILGFLQPVFVSEKMCMKGEGQEQLYSPLHWFGRKLPDFPQSAVPLSHSTSVAGARRWSQPFFEGWAWRSCGDAGLVPNPLTSTANCVHFICNWKHDSRCSVFFTWSICPQYCEVHRYTFNFTFFSSLYSSCVNLGWTCHICETFQSTWVYRGASKDAYALGFSRHIPFYSLL